MTKLCFTPSHLFEATGIAGEITGFEFIGTEKVSLIILNGQFKCVLAFKGFTAPTCSRDLIKSWEQGKMCFTARNKLIILLLGIN